MGLARPRPAQAADVVAARTRRVGRLPPMPMVGIGGQAFAAALGACPRHLLHIDLLEEGDPEPHRMGGESPAIFSTSYLSLAGSAEGPLSAARFRDCTSKGIGPLRRMWLFGTEPPEGPKHEWGLCEYGKTSGTRSH